jgi:hypothetical protein
MVSARLPGDVTAIVHGNNPRQLSCELDTKIGPRHAVVNTAERVSAQLGYLAEWACYFRSLAMHHVPHPHLCPQIEFLARRNFDMVLGTLGRVHAQCYEPRRRSAQEAKTSHG